MLARARAAAEKAADSLAAGAAGMRRDLSIGSDDGVQQVPPRPSASAQQQADDFLPAPPTQPTQAGPSGEMHVMVRWGLQPEEPEPEEFEVQYGFRLVGAWRRASIAACSRDAEEGTERPLWTAEVDELEPGGRYLVRVRAKNDWGWGRWSTRSEPIATLDHPSATAAAASLPPPPPAATSIPPVVEAAMDEPAAAGTPTASATVAETGGQPPAQAAAATRTFDIAKDAGGGGFGMRIDVGGVVSSYSYRVSGGATAGGSGGGGGGGGYSAAEASGVPLGCRIVGVAGRPVASKLQILSVLAEQAALGVPSVCFECAVPEGEGCPPAPASPPASAAAGTGGTGGGGGGGVTGGGGGLSARLSTVSWGGLREQAVTSAASLAVGAKRASASASTFVRELELAELRDSVSENG
jgi:hypothetical protein